MLSVVWKASMDWRESQEELVMANSTIVKWNLLKREFAYVEWFDL